MRRYRKASIRNRSRPGTRTTKRSRRSSRRGPTTGIRPTTIGNSAQRGASTGLAAAGLRGEVLALVGDALPALRVGGRLLPAIDPGPELCIVGVQAEPDLEARVGIRLDRFDRAFGL